MIAYVADALAWMGEGAVHAVELAGESGRILATMPVKYNPDVSMSVDGSTQFVVHTYLDEPVDGPMRDELLVVDAASFALRHRVRFTWRSVYNVAPTGPTLVPSLDGRYLYVNKTQTLGDDAAINTVGVYDIAAAEFLPGEIQLPYQLIHFGPVAGGGGVYFVLSGRLGEGLGYLENATGAEPQWVHRYPAGDPMRFKLAGSAAHPTESVVYVITKAGLIQRWWPLTRQLAPPVSIGMPEGLAIPMQHVVATVSGLLLVGVSDRESASCGLSAGILEFGLEDGFGGDPRRAWKLEPLAEKILASKDGKSLLGLSRLDRSMSVYDVESGERMAYLGGIGVAPVAVAGAGIP